MRTQAGIQITLLVIAIIIAFSVIKPKIESIRTEQNEIASYQEAVQNIGLYNQRLQELISQAAGLSATDRAALWRYLPEEVDATSVASDIANIADRNQLLLLDIVAGDVSPVTTAQPDFEGQLYDQTVDPGVVVNFGDSLAGVLMAQKFQVEVVGTYDQIKNMLQDLERNAYPLRLVSFEFDTENDGSTLVQYSLILETYALPVS